MSLKDTIEDQVDRYITSNYSVDDGYSIPLKTDITFGPHAKKINHAVAVYIDIRGSRKILSNHGSIATARAHKSFIYAASKCLKDQDGKLRSFNGDSILCFFSGENDAKRAVKAAMKIKCAIREIVNPKLLNSFQEDLDFGIGIGQGDILVVKSGVPGEEITQDLIWLGWPTYVAYEFGNYAKTPYNIMISENVYKDISSDTEMIYSNNKNMWSLGNDNFKSGNRNYYSTSYYWNL